MASEATERCFLIIRVSNVLNALESTAFYLKKNTEGLPTYKLPEFMKCTISKYAITTLNIVKNALICWTWLKNNILLLKLIYSVIIQWYTKNTCEKNYFLLFSGQIFMQLILIM